MFWWFGGLVVWWFGGRYLPMDIRGKGVDYRNAPLITGKDSHWDMMDVVKVI